MQKHIQLFIRHEIFGHDSLFVHFYTLYAVCPGRCDYRTHQHTQHGCSIDTDVMCVCNPAFRPPNCTEPTFIPRQVELEPITILSATDYQLEVMNVCLLTGNLLYPTNNTHHTQIHILYN